MPIYEHFQQAKKAESLPESEKVGACITCKWWNADAPRPRANVNQIAVCIYPQLKEYALLVSGSSGCNKWQEHPDAGAEAKQYAEQGQ